MYIDVYDSPLGALTLASDGGSLTGLWLERQRYYGLTLGPNPVRRHVPLFDLAKAWLDAYFHGDAPAVDLPLAPVGGPFRQRVWAILREIPYGQVTTYGAIARRLAAEAGKARLSAQAVGGAVGHNQISIIIPCHRVVGSDGRLTGYAGGIDKKEWLLRLEKAVTAEIK